MPCCLYIGLIYSVVVYLEACLLNRFAKSSDLLCGSTEITEQKREMKLATCDENVLGISLGLEGGLINMH